ncbi:MAG: redoxin domain-containing protein [Planctomycetes bacterium]|nr:redoxin domain-containing protein [Planctomycetota bacterium]
MGRTLVGRIAAAAAIALLLAAHARATSPVPVAGPAPLAVRSDGLGAEAPQLSDVEWVRGKKFKRYARGTTYVLLFFTTWLSECVRQEARLDLLQDEYADRRVSVVGVCAWPLFGTLPAEEFCDKRGDALRISVVRDKNNATAKAWDRVIDFPDTPSVVIVDGKGRIAWVGRPSLLLREALDAVLAGDDAALAAACEQRDAAAKKNTELLERLAKLRKWEMWDKVPGQVDALLELLPDANAPFALDAYYARLKTDPPAADAPAWGRRIVDEFLSDSPKHLDGLAWSIVSPTSAIPEERRDLELARLAAERAFELSPRDWSVLDTLARVRFLAGETDEAVALQERAVAEAFSSEQKETAALRLEVYVDGKDVDPERLAAK